MAVLISVRLVSVMKSCSGDHLLCLRFASGLLERSEMMMCAGRTVRLVGDTLIWLTPLGRKNLVLIDSVTQPSL